MNKTLAQSLDPYSQSLDRQAIEACIKAGQIREFIQHYQAAPLSLSDDYGSIQQYVHNLRRLATNVPAEQFHDFVTSHPDFLTLLTPFIEYQSQFDNLYQCCVPKTASTWLKEIFIDLRFVLYSGLLPFQVDFLKKSRIIPQRSIVTGTFAVSYQEFQALEKPENYRAFFVMRDPRDIVVSAYFSNRYSHKLMDHIAETRKVLESLPVAEGIIYTINTLKGVFSILRSWIRESKNDPNILLLRYEDLTGERSFQAFQALFEHCDVQIPDETVNQVLADYSFDKLSQGRQQGREDQKSHYRKGVSGDWKNYFDSNVRLRFEEAAGDLVGELGYEWDGAGMLGEAYQPLTSNPSPSVAQPPVGQAERKGQTEQLLETAKALYDTGQFHKSLNLYQNAARLLQSHLAHTHFYSGRIQQQLEQFEPAISSYQQALKLNPEMTDAYFFLGHLFSKQDQLEAAIQNYQTFLAKRPNAADVYFHLAVLYSRQEDLAKAEQYFKRFLKMRPESADAHFRLGGLYLKQGDLKHALSSYRKSIDHNPNLVDAYFYMGEICLKMGQVERAMKLHSKHKHLKGLSQDL
ncbi:MAG: tetratricopeptide repeat protein [Microcoleaceae cyanobacterium]